MEKTQSYISAPVHSQNEVCKTKDTASLITSISTVIQVAIEEGIYMTKDVASEITVKSIAILCA
jgi:hypothetical protein